VWCSTPVETLPSSVAASVLRPRDPMTITAASSSSAQATIAANTAPALRMTFGWASNPAAAASCTPSAAIASASLRVAASMSATASLTIAFGSAISAPATAFSSGDDGGQGRPSYRAGHEDSRTVGPCGR
jgi:hypothetical protein